MFSWIILFAAGLREGKGRRTQGAGQMRLLGCLRDLAAVWQMAGALTDGDVEAGVHVDAVHVALLSTLQAFDIKAGLTHQLSVLGGVGSRAPDDAAAWHHLASQHLGQVLGCRQVLPVHMVHQDHLHQCFC